MWASTPFLLFVITDIRLTNLRMGVLARRVLEHSRVTFSSQAQIWPPGRLEESALDPHMYVRTRVLDDLHLSLYRTEYMLYRNQRARLVCWYVHVYVHVYSEYVQCRAAGGRGRCHIPVSLPVMVKMGHATGLRVPR